MRDPYSVLGVKRNADADEIKAAWRSKAKTVHPDHNLDDPSATGRFAEVGQAYDVLKDPERRKRYDKASDMHQTIMQQRDSARQAAERAKAAQANAEKIMEELARANAQRAQAQAQSQAKSQTKGQAGQSAESPEDMVERIFGGAAEAKAGAHTQSQQAQPNQAQSQQAQSQQTQAQQQSQAKAAPQAGNAEAAAGNAAETAAEIKPPLPLMAVDLIASLVRRIRGTGPVPEKAPDLSVDTTVTIEELLKQASVSVHLGDEREVRFPLERGMTEGFVVRLKGQGLKVPGLKQGDLLVRLKVARDSRFRIEGFNLHTTLSISLEDAVLGSEANIETPDGIRSVTVPAWSGSDQSVRLEGLGLPDDAGGRGELVVELRVLLWEKPDEKVKDLMRHMRHGLYV